jgi:hypothetical protein
MIFCETRVVAKAYDLPHLMDPPPKISNAQILLSVLYYVGNILDTKLYVPDFDVFGWGYPKLPDE